MNHDEQGGLHASDQRVRQGAPSVQEYADEIDIAALLRVIWRRKVWIAVATAFVTIAAIAYALTATEWYRAEVILMPRDSGSSGGLAGQLAQLGGLASMAGITLGQNSRQEPLGLLRSVGFARRFVEKNDLVSVLSEETDLAAGVARDARDARDQKVQRVVETFKNSIFSIVEDKKTGLITVAIEWKEPVVAANWANEIPRQLNEEMRQRALDESTRNVQYLKGQLDHTEMVSLQQAISRLIESEMQKLMLAQGTEEYAFRVIDDAHPPYKRARPKRTVLVIVVFLGGLFASTLATILFDPFRALVQQVSTA